MTQEIKPGSCWTYIGPGPGRGFKHVVLSTRPGEVITWSEPSKDPSVGGYTWLGQPYDFRKQFVPVNQEKA